MELTAQAALVTEKVNHLLSEQDLPAALTIERCASELAMSMTSFRRKLAEEDTSFKLIQTKFLHELCINQLSHSSVKIDDLAIRLGYSERATFERAFKQKFGLTPSQYRVLAIGNKEVSGKKSLFELAKSIPPMSESCQKLVALREQDGLDLNKVTTIIEHDPILTGRIIGQASKAIYGKTPNNLQEAIGRNIGVESVVNLAVLFAVSDALSDSVDAALIEKYRQAFVLAPRIVRWCYRSKVIDKSSDNGLTEQVLMFALIGVFLLNHSESENNRLILHAMQGVEELDLLNQHVKSTLGVSVFAASSLMLTQWSIDARVIKQLTLMDKQSLTKGKGSNELARLIFLLTCFYRYACAHPISEAFTAQAEHLGMEHFEELLTLLCEA